MICAPIRRGKKVFGVLHLYSTQTGKTPDADDLEFTLAVADTVAVALHNLSRRQELAENLIQVRSENQQLRERLGVQSEIVGKSPLMGRIAEEIARAASSKATVLIRGESGVGKELVARAIHYSSPRRKGVFVCLNCAALTESLLESELFGHEKGAFTGATERKIGKFEAAHNGTLMLDEIGEMSPTIQAKFLRVLEGHPFERVGGSEPVKVDVRVIAATNRDLEKDVAEGRFRRDLYFRLHVLAIHVPPLRKRPDDIPELCLLFLQKFIAETGRKINGFTPRAMDQLTRYRWPGNVRELRNVIERAVVLCAERVHRPGRPVLSKLSTAGDTAELPPPVAAVHARLAGRDGAAAHPGHAERHRAGTRARPPASWASSARRSTARSAATRSKKRRAGRVNKNDCHARGAQRCMANHPNKHIREAIEYAEAHGWRLHEGKRRAHIFGTLWCPLATREGCRFRVYSTPRHPEDHARDIRPLSTSVRTRQS